MSIVPAATSAATTVPLTTSLASRSPISAHGEARPAKA